MIPKVERFVIAVNHQPFVPYTDSERVLINTRIQQIKDTVRALHNLEFQHSRAKALLEGGHTIEHIYQTIDAMGRTRSIWLIDGETDWEGFSMGDLNVLFDTDNVMGDVSTPNDTEVHTVFHLRTDEVG
jgi:hypothetical protein